MDALAAKGMERRAITLDITLMTGCCDLNVVMYIDTLDNGPVQRRFVIVVTFYLSLALSNVELCPGLTGWNVV